jgi:hypothetical protein
LAFRFVGVHDGPGFEDVAPALAEEDVAVAHSVCRGLNLCDGLWVRRRACAVR